MTNNSSVLHYHITLSSCHKEQIHTFTVTVWFTFSIKAGSVAMIEAGCATMIATTQSTLLLSTATYRAVFPFYFYEQRKWNNCESIPTKRNIDIERSVGNMHDLIFMEIIL